MAGSKNIMLVAQKSAAQEEPAVSDMHGTGCIASILQLLKLPDNTVKVLVEGRQRAGVQAVVDNEKYFSATVVPKPAGDVLSQQEQGISSVLGGWHGIFAHMMLIDEKPQARWLDSHPPLQERIRRIYGRDMPPLQLQAIDQRTGQPRVASEAPLF